MKTLLVPLDFSDATKLVLDYAAEIARDLSAKVILLHVVEPMSTYVPVGATMDVISAMPPVPDSGESLAADEKHLHSLGEPLRATGLAVEEIAIVGIAVDDILDQASRRNVDYILLGSHGRGALYHLFSGSVVTGVLKRAACPVIVIPSKKSG